MEETLTIGVVPVAAPVSTVLEIGLGISSKSGSGTGIAYSVARAALAPTVASVEPDSAFAVGGQQITLTGANFLDAPNPVLTVGANPATGVVVEDTATIRCTAPPSPPAAAQSLRVTNAAGAGELSGAFSFFAFPPQLAPEQALESVVSGNTSIVRDGPRVWLLYQRGSNGQELCCRRSEDHGTSWSAPIVLSSGAFVRFPALAVSGDCVYVAWGAALYGADVMFRRSTDGGQDFDDAVRIDTSGPPTTGSSDSLGVHASGERVCVSWTEGYSVGVTPSIRCAASQDRGASFATDVAVSHSPATAQDCAAVFDVDRIAVVWRDLRDPGGPSVWCNRSDDGGLTWQPADTRLDDGTGCGLAPKIARGDGAWLVLWTGEIAGTPQVLVNRSVDGGATWLGATVVTATATSPVSLEFAVGGTSACAMWTEMDGPGAFSIRFSRTGDLGATWLVTPVLLAQGPGLGTDGLAFDGTSLVATWSFNTAPPVQQNQCYAAFSASAGAGFAAPQPLGPPTVGNGPSVEVSIDGARFLAVRSEANGLFGLRNLGPME
jgi:hypothetical protein